MRDLHDAFLLTEDPEDLELSWRAALVRRPPGSVLTEKFTTPVLLHLHGAFGFSECETVLTELCYSMGIAFVAPNSFARRHRVSNCLSGSIETGGFPLADLYRRSELIYAYHALLQESWVDPNRIALSGFSEGAAAVSVWGSEVRCCAALVISWSCSAPHYCDWVDGLRLPPDVPVLQAVSAHDPWFDRDGWRTTRLPRRTAFRQLIFSNTAEHDVYILPSFQDACSQFFRDHVRYPTSSLAGALSIT